MTLRACALAVGLAALPTTAVASDFVRLTDRDDLFGWEAVGRGDLAGTGFCTGVLIATNLVLTAAHCLYDAKDQLLPPGREARGLGQIGVQGHRQKRLPAPGQKGHDRRRAAPEQAQIGTADGEDVAE